MGSSQLPWTVIELFFVFFFFQFLFALRKVSSDYRLFMRRIRTSHVLWGPRFEPYSEISVRNLQLYNLQSEGFSFLSFFPHFGWRTSPRRLLGMLGFCRESRDSRWSLEHSFFFVEKTDVRLRISLFTPKTNIHSLLSRWWSYHKTKGRGPWAA